MIGLPDVLILKLLRAEISQRRVEPWFVVHVLNEVRQVLGDVLEGFERHGIKALGFGVVIGISLSPH